MPRKVPFSIAFDLPFDEAIEAARARKSVLPDAYYHQLPAEARKLAFTVSGLTALDQVQGVLDRMGRHIEDGGTFADFKRLAASQPWELPKHRLETIFRNAVQTAYGAGHWRRFEETKDDQPYLMYDAVNDSRTRPAHRALDGIIRPVDDPFWLTHSPPMGHNCRCTLIQLDAEQAEIRSRNGRGLNQPETPEMRGDDDGWGRKPMQWDETLRNVIRERQSACLPGPFGFGRKKRDPHVNIDCSPSGSGILSVLEGMPDPGAPAPAPRHGTLPLLPESHRQAEEWYMRAFFERLGAKEPMNYEREIFPGYRLSVSRRIFEDAKSRKSKLTKEGRHRYLLYLAESITSPDEVWIRADGRMVLLAAWEIARKRQTMVLVFERDGAYWSGISGYQTTAGRHVEDQRKGVRLWLREE